MSYEAEIMGYQLAERLKSGLIMAQRLMDVFSSLTGGERGGARKIMLTFLEGLLNETQLASNFTSMQEFAEIASELRDVMRKVETDELSDSNLNIGRAVSRATTACDAKIKALKVIFEND
ncbi:hypothetical protein [Candidatus Alkanophaga liquidiphilum]|nr:hypothetical protein [Candidatus Alkanophaga liquidiphilum]RLG38815.1 MAG: hypothetical protein DRN91_01590 [Candidatus Alkanophagales archaeon]